MKTLECSSWVKDCLSGTVECSCKLSRTTYSERGVKGSLRRLMKDTAAESPAPGLFRVPETRRCLWEMGLLSVKSKVSEPSSISVVLSGSLMKQSRGIGLAVFVRRSDAIVDYKSTCTCYFL